MKHPLTLLALLTLAPGLAMASAEHVPLDIRHVGVGELHPTQPALGYRQMDYKQGRFAVDRKKFFDEFCETGGQGGIDQFDDASSLKDTDSFTCTDDLGSHPEDMKTAVIAPDSGVYITDGHHTFSNYLALEGPELSVPVLITHDFSDLPNMESFWAAMQDERLVWLDAPSGPITPEDLPERLGRDAQADDAYRSLVYFTRGVGYEKPDTPPPFLEFYWGQWLAGQLPLEALDLTTLEGYTEAVTQAATLMVEVPADTVIADTATGSLTAQEMGQLPAFNDQELEKLLSERGKLTYAFSVEK
ncbi:ParB/Srx family N-terminal domain-containing protein [Vreelandella populi]|uniref:ParB/Srx family N-terminal domain-containing protein n=1 Tax=Vreelandella populi TaxID=2498858 RepID=UPI000F8DA572|nr:ParB/Srx family N-terminal domain-containing protein [Halomonas populi]RUR57218.1 hypothetical protein ELY40_02105 [Halomonas populi]